MQNLMLSWQQGAELTGGLALVSVGLRQIRQPKIRPVTALATEATIIAALYTVWQLAGVISLTGADHAFTRAAWIARFEHRIHLPSEASVQSLVLGHPLIVQCANLYYASMHFTIAFVFLLWMFLRYRDRYSGVRTTLAIATLTCLAISILLPVAPPRMLSSYVDTASVYGQSVYGGNIVDEVSAMPSVHVLWASMIAWYAIRIGRSRWRYLAGLHFALTVFVVVCTGNHWWMDGIVAITVAVACAWAQVGVVRAFRRRPAEPTVPVPEAEPVTVG